MATRQSQAASDMVSAASQFLGSLNEDQKAKATYDYMDGERMFGITRPSTATACRCGTWTPVNVNWRWP